jgi:hypothetical protein
MLSDMCDESREFVAGNFVLNIKKKLVGVTCFDESREFVADIFFTSPKYEGSDCMGKYTGH